MKLFIGICLVLALLNPMEARVFSRCQLARELKAKGFPVNQLPDWVCLVESESSRNTAAKGGPNSDGSYDWGLFQINDRYWCKPGQKGGDCKITCESLLTDDISAASSCAKLIYSRHNFSAWYGWIKKCKGKPLPDLSSCGV